MGGRNLKRIQALIPVAILFALLLSWTVTFAADPSDDYLHAANSALVDAAGDPVRLTGIAWFGFETQNQVYHGLWSVNMEAVLDTVADLGFNVVRIPLCVQLVNQWRNGNGGTPNSVNYTANPGLEGMSSLEILDASVAYCKKVGLKVMLDMHRVVNTQMLDAWYTEGYPASDFEACWQWLAQHYADDDTVIAMDLFNEPHGAPGDTAMVKWDDSTDPNNWKHEAEKVANLVLNVNPELLVVVEGVEATPKAGYTYAETNSANYDFNWWGGNLRRVKDYPIDLGSRQGQVVYSPHDYGPGVYAQPWFYAGFTKATLTADCWQPNWLYIAMQDFAPVLVGEWGGRMDGGDNQKWMGALADTIAQYDLNHTFWCVNPNSGDTGGILLDDWQSVDTAKYNLIEPTLWKDANGKFVGLDHLVDLGANGTHVGAATIPDDDDDALPEACSGQCNAATPVYPELLSDGGLGNVTMYSTAASNGGACNYGTTDVMYYAAMSVNVLPDDAQGQWQGGRICGQCAEVTALTSQGPQSVVVRIMDKCPDAFCGIDLGGAAPAQIMLDGSGRYTGKWRFVSCDGHPEVSDGPPTLHVLAGSNAWWSRVHVRNGSTATESIEWQSTEDSAQGEFPYATDPENAFEVPTDEVLQSGMSAVLITVHYIDGTTASVTLTPDQLATEDASYVLDDADVEPPPDPDPTPATHADNPFVGADGYINPDYTAKVLAEAQSTGGTLGASMAEVADYSTAIWLDRIAAIEGSADVMGLRDHLDEALQQQNGDTPLTIMLVIYDLPNRDCAAAASNGELRIAEDGLNIYKTEYIDPIVEILSDPKYSSLNIVTVVEPDSLPNLVTNLDIAACAEANSSGVYIDGIRYAIDRLHPMENVYIYLDIAHSGWLGWDSNFNPAVQLYLRMLQGTAAGVDSIDGFITNTANYTPVEEVFLPDANLNVGGQPLKAANFYEWNPYFDETDYAMALRSAFINAGMPSTIGMLIDTSRSGWGGSQRPDGVSSASDLNTYVDESRLDRRPHRGGWCNQVGAGIGERPQATPASGIDAFVWVKPPGESDGVSSDGIVDPDDPNKQFDVMCDPNAQSRFNAAYPTNAMPGAPHAGHWFAEQFRMLVENADPPLVGDSPPPIIVDAPSNLTIDPALLGQYGASY